MTIARFSQDDQNMLDGKGRASPFGVPALRLLIGTLFNTIIDTLNTGAFAPDLADDSAGKGASLVALESGGDWTATDLQGLAEEQAAKLGVTEFALVNITTPAEAANNIDFAVAVVKMDGSTALARAQRLLLEILLPDMTPAASADFTLAETGAGTPVSTGTKAAILIDASSGGLATVRAHDVAGASSQSLYLRVTPIMTGTTQPGFPRIVAFAFDGS